MLLVYYDLNMEDEASNSSNKENMSKEEQLEEKGKEWEKKADEWGEELEKKIENEIEKKVPKFFEGLFGAIATAVFMILLNVFYDRIGFLTSEFEDLLPLINLSFAISIIFNLSTAFIHNKTYKRITTIISNIIFFFVAYQTWVIFPFDTSVIGNQDTWDKLFKGIIILTVFAVAIGTIVDMIKLIMGKDEEFC